MGPRALRQEGSDVASFSAVFLGRAPFVIFFGRQGSVLKVWVSSWAKACNVPQTGLPWRSSFRASLTWSSGEDQMLLLGKHKRDLAESLFCKGDTKARACKRLRNV